MLIENAGFLELQNFPRCTSKAALPQAIHDWQELFELYGTNIPEANKRLMLLNILPNDMMEELWGREEFDTTTKVLTEVDGANTSGERSSRSPRDSEDRGACTPSKEETGLRRR